MLGMAAFLSICEPTGSFGALYDARTRQVAYDYGTFSGRAWWQGGSPAKSGWTTSRRARCGGDVLAPRALCAFWFALFGPRDAGEPLHRRISRCCAPGRWKWRRRELNPRFVPAESSLLQQKHTTC